MFGSKILHLTCSLFLCFSLFENLRLGFLLLLCLFLFEFPFPFVFPFLTFSLTFPDISSSVVVLDFPDPCFFSPDLCFLVSDLKLPFTLLFPYPPFPFFILFLILFLFIYFLLLDCLLFLNNAPLPIPVKCLCFTAPLLLGSFAKEDFDFWGKTRLLLVILKV